MKRFWDKVDKSGDCWLWKAGVLKDGYGSFSLNGKTQSAHRVSYELLVGPLLPEEKVLHVCDVTGCVRPDHLFKGSSADNTADRLKKDRGGFKINNAIAKQIKHARGTHRAIADELDISCALVTMIKRGQRWRHI